MSLDGMPRKVNVPSGSILPRARSGASWTKEDPMATADTIKVSSEGAVVHVTADLGDGIELNLDVVSTTRAEMQTPQTGGPEVQERTTVVLTIIDQDDSFVFFVGEGDADINETFNINGRDGTVHIEGTVPMVNEEGNTIPLTLDLTIETSGPFVRNNGHEQFLEPGEVNIHANSKGSHAPATVTGTFSLAGQPPAGSFDLSTLNITSQNAEIFTESAGTVVVAPGSDEWLV
jgi:hypothetical protein